MARLSVIQHSYTSQFSSYYGMFVKCYSVSGNLIFNTVGANAEMQKICKQVFLTVSLLTLDGQLGGSALILWLQKSFISTHVDLLEMWVLGVGTVITTIWTALGFFGVIN